jgi:hypothetical protein
MWHNAKKTWLLVTLGFLQLAWTMQDLYKEFPCQLLTPLTQGESKVTVPTVGDDHIQGVSHTYLSYSKCYKYPPPPHMRAGIDACMCLIVFAKTHDSSIWEMFLMNAIQIQSNFWLILYIILHTARQSAVYTSSVELCLWNGSHIALNHAFLCLSLELIFRNCQLPSTYSALQLAVEHRPECTDWLKTKNTVSQIIETGCGYHTVSYSVGILVISRE